MAWDNDKSTAADPDNPQADEQLTANEWDNHVSEGHFPGDELNFGVDGNGDPVITDPQNGGQTVMRYDRSAGSWVVDALEAGEISRQNWTEEIAGTDLADDTATSLSLSNSGLSILFTKTGKNAIISTGFNTITLMSSRLVTNQGNSTTLTGTDGTDGDFSVAIDNNILSIENRTGSDVSFGLIEFNLG